MSRQFWSEPVDWKTVAGTALANTTTEGLLHSVLTLPPNYLQSDRIIRVRGFGSISTTGSPTFIWAMRLGGLAGTVIWQTEALTQGTTQTNLNWALEVVIQTRSAGPTGTVICMGEVSWQTTTTACSAHVASVSGGDAPAATTVDTTIAQDLALTGDWSAASASNTATCHILFHEALN